MRTRVVREARIAERATQKTAHAHTHTLHCTRMREVCGLNSSKHALATDWAQSARALNHCGSARRLSARRARARASAAAMEAAMAMMTTMAMATAATTLCEIGTMATSWTNLCSSHYTRSRQGDKCAVDRRRITLDVL